MEKKYLQIEFSTGLFFEYSSTEKEGFKPHEGKKGTVYRKYYDKISGTLESAQLYESKFGDQISLRIKNEDTIYCTPIDLYNQRREVGSYAQSLITFLPNLKKGMNIIIKGYNFIPKDSQYTKIGISIVSDGKKIERAISFKDAPKLEFVEKRGSKTGKKQPTAVSIEARNNFFLDVMEKALKNLAWEGNGEQPAEQKPVVKEEKKEPKPKEKKAVEVKVDNSDSLPF